MKVRKAWNVIVLPVVATLALTVLVVHLFAQSGPVVPDVGFEIEGNTALDQGGEYDWETVGVPPSVRIHDPNSKAETDPTTFRPNSKFDDPATWSVVPSQVGPGQNELTNILAWAILPGDLDDSRPEHFWLILGMERTKQEGTFDLDFEFNQLAWDGATGGPTRTPGDLVVGFELKGNPTDRQADLQVLIAQYQPGTQPSKCKVTPGVGNAPALVEVGDEPCPPYGDSGWYYRFLADGVLFADSGLGQATMNEESFAAPWPSTDARGRPRSMIGPFQFAEAAIDLTALGVEAGCSTFSTVHAKSRSSLEVESDLKDLAGPIPLGIECRLDGHKFLDVDGDGTWDRPGEPPLPGWEITLSDGSVAVTDADGYYAFENLKDGLYTVQEVCPDGGGWAQTAPGLTDFEGCGDEVHTADINIDNREANDLDFGNGRPLLGLSKTCTPDVFLGDDIEYEITVCNPGEVYLYDLTVADPVVDLKETLDLLAPGECKIFSGKYNSAPSPNPEHFLLYLPQITRGFGLQPAPPIQTVTNTASAEGQYALATVSDPGLATCTTKVHRLQVYKVAQAALQRAYKWTCDKAADDPGPHVLFPGDSTDVEYTVTVDLDNSSGDGEVGAVQGTIIISNTAPMDADLVSVVDVVSPDIVAGVDCPALVVPAGGSLTCTYGPVQLPDTSNRTNAATVSLLNNNGQTRDFVATALVDFDQAIVEEIDKEAQVSDSFAGDLGTARYDDVPAPFVYPWRITAAGDVCDLATISNTAKVVALDTGTTVTCSADVEIFELCEATVAFEDLPLGDSQLDWDYNDWVARIEISPTFESALGNGDLLQMDFVILPEARGASLDHVFGMSIPPTTFGCDGTYSLTRYDGGGDVLDRETGSFDSSAESRFEILSSTEDAFPDKSNTDVSKPYVPTNRTALLSIVFDDACPFDLGDWDPLATYHGEGVFFGAYLCVCPKNEMIDVGDVRTLFVPAGWKWPREKVPVWKAYPKVIPGAVGGRAPEFTRQWWLEYKPGEVYEKP